MQQNRTVLNWITCNEIIHPYSTKKTANLVFRVLDSYTNVVAESMGGKAEQETVERLILRKSMWAFHFQSDKNFDLYHTHHLGSFGKCSLISAGSSAKSTWGFPSKMPFNFSSQFTKFLLFGSCSIKETTLLLVSLFNIHIKQRTKTRQNCISGLNLKFQTCNLSVFRVKVVIYVKNCQQCYQKSYLTIRKVYYIFNSSR